MWPIFVPAAEKVYPFDIFIARRVRSYHAQVAFSIYNVNHIISQQKSSEFKLRRSPGLSFDIAL
jgi:hypothetical protein